MPNPPAETPRAAAPDQQAKVELTEAMDVAQRTASPVGAWLAPLLVPPVIGVALIVIVAFDVGDSIITYSPGAAAAAMAVGALLILGSAALYVASPVRYDHFFTDVRTRIERGMLAAGAHSKAPDSRRDD